MRITIDNQEEADSDQPANQMEEISDDETYRVEIGPFIDASDIDKLPEHTPESFKTYLYEVLSNNAPSDYGCIGVYFISSISRFNINGARTSRPVDDEADMYSCGSGAPALWVQTPDGSWEEVDGNGPHCVSENGGLVYEDFASSCYDADWRRINNPNGPASGLTE